MVKRYLDNGSGHGPENEIHRMYALPDAGGKRQAEADDGTAEREGAGGVALAGEAQLGVGGAAQVSGGEDGFQHDGEAEVLQVEQVFVGGDVHGCDWVWD